MALPPVVRRELLDVVGPNGLVDDPERLGGYASDWTGRFAGRPTAVVRPGQQSEVAAIVGIARNHGIALVPQGGATGLVGGATACDGEVVVDLRRLAGIVDLDATSGQLTALAGTPIADVQAAAAGAGWAYGVDWAARDTATLGGSVATDAGGLRFVRHGSTRRQLLGVAAVLGTGEVISHLPRVEKDNTGYDLAALLCGSEGTLGLVTAARVRLVAPLPPLATALLAFGHIGDAVAAAHALRRGLPGLEAVELVLAAGIDLVRDAFDLPAPFSGAGVGAAAVLLVESDDGVALGDAVGGMAGVLEAAVALDGPRRRALWRYRELHTEAINRVGVPHKLDVTLPAGELARFITEVPSLVAAVAPGARTWCFGHAADGNVHVNVTGVPADDGSVDQAVFEAVAAAGGSISAEHGIGRAKRRWLGLAHGPSEISTMRRIKAALDPDGICNPNVLLP